MDLRLLCACQVNIAEQWQEARQNEIDGHGAKQLEYDWTFTTPYAGTLDRESHVNGNGVSCVNQHL